MWKLLLVMVGAGAPLRWARQQAARRQASRLLVIAVMVMAAGSSAAWAQSHASVRSLKSSSVPANEKPHESKNVTDKELQVRDTSPVEVNSAQKLVRLDFQVAGTSCVACIRRVSNKFQTAPGVLKADVSIYKPHWAVVIFDADKTNQDAVLQAVKTESVYMEALEATPLAAMPAVVVPRAANPMQTAGKP